VAVGPAEPEVCHQRGEPPRRHEVEADQVIVEVAAIVEATPMVGTPEGRAAGPSLVAVEPMPIRAVAIAAMAIPVVPLAVVTLLGVVAPRVLMVSIVATVAVPRGSLGEPVAFTAVPVEAAMIVASAFSGPMVALAITALQAIPIAVTAVMIAVTAVMVAIVAAHVVATVIPVILGRGGPRRDGPRHRGGEGEAQQAKTSMSSHGRISFPSACDPSTGPETHKFGEGDFRAWTAFWAL